MLRRILTFLGSVFVLLIVIGGTLLLVAYGQGYFYDFKENRLIRNGLVLINSVPNGSVVKENGEVQSKRTPYRATLPRGEYQYEVTRENFRTWSKRLTVTPGQVTSAQYVLLLPQDLIKRSLTLAPPYQTPAVSKNRSILSYSVAATETDPTAVFTHNLPDGQPQRRLQLPEETITDLKWSADASHLLVVSQGPQGKIARVMEDDGSNVQNLTDIYKFDFTSLQFSPIDWQQLFWISPDGLRRLDLESQAVSGVIAPGVTQFSFAGGRVIFVQATPLGKSLISAGLGDLSKKQELVQALAESDTYTISYSKYSSSNFQSNDHLVVIPNRSRTATIYSGIFGSSPVATIAARDVERAEFSPDGRFVALYGPNKLVTYDVERSTPTKIVNYEAPALPGPITGISWFDDFHILINAGERTIFADFDGTNQVVLSGAAATLTPFASTGRRSVYAIESDGPRQQRLVNVTIR